MTFSLFYHLCDQEAFSGVLPEGLQQTCLVLYVNNEVLQFCDFFSAILSFWVGCVLRSLQHTYILSPKFLTTF